MPSKSTAVRARIVEAAARLFDAQGYQGTRVEDIGAAVELNKASLYYYFTNKADILFAILNETTDRFLSHLESLPGDVPADDILSAVITFHLDELVARPHEAGIYFRELPWFSSWLPPEQYQEIRVKELSYLSRITAIIQRGIDSGEFAATDARVAAFGLLGMNAWAFNWYRAGDGLSTDDLASVFVRLILGGLHGDLRR